jgi:hypothetical protein
MTAFVENCPFRYLFFQNTILTTSINTHKIEKSENHQNFAPHRPAQTRAMGHRGAAHPKATHDPKAIVRCLNIVSLLLRKDKFDNGRRFGGQ